MSYRIEVEKGCDMIRGWKTRFKPYYDIAANTRDVLTLDTQDHLGLGLD